MQNEMNFNTASKNKVENKSFPIKGGTYYSKMKLPTPSIAYEAYWEFAFKRQEVFFDKIAGHVGESYLDPIISKYRFTNVYRASDRVSQFLISRVLYNDEWSFEDTVFRTLLFKIFNKIETWQLIEAKIGQIYWDKKNLLRIGEVLDDAFQRGRSVYSAAYIMPSAKSVYQQDRKHSNHLRLIDSIMSSSFLNKLRGVNSLEGVYNALVSLPSIGPFLAFQYAIDLNYSSYFNFSENSFVKAGPGAKDGIRKCFTDLGDYSWEDVIRMMQENQEASFEVLGLNFKKLWGRDLHLIDCQNLFCETDKYCRVKHPDLLVGSKRVRIKQKYKPNLEKVEYYFPPKWGLNIS